MVDLIEELICGICSETTRIDCKKKDVPCMAYDSEYIKTKKALKQWLSSFDTSSATKCFEAVNILKMKIAQEEMHEADERLLNSDWGEMEVQE